MPGGRKNFVLRFQVSIHEGRSGFHGERQHIFNPRRAYCHIESDVVAALRRADDLSDGHDMGVEQLRIHGLQIGVAVGAVDDGMKFSVQRQGDDCRNRC